MLKLKLTEVVTQSIGSNERSLEACSNIFTAFKLINKLEV
jgi:hypothetical protein